MKRQCTLRRYFPLLGAIFLFSCNTAFADGYSENNGGDGVWTEGRFVLRDFIEKSELIWDNKVFLENIPGFADYIRELSHYDAGLALSIWDGLVSLRIWVTSEKLIPLPQSQTDLTERSETVEPVAIRGKDDLIINLSAFEKSDRIFVLVHEALHPMIPGSDAFHHAKVRSMVRFLKESRCKITVESLKKAEEKIGLTYSYHSSSSYEFLHRIDPDLKIPEYEVRRILIQDREGTLEARCSLLELAELTLGEGLIPRTWGSYDQCETTLGLDKNPEGMLTLLWKIYPDLKDAYTHGIGYYWIPPSRLEDPVSDSNAMLELCRQYTSFSIVQNALQERDRSEKVMRILSDDRAHFDSVTRLYIQIAVQNAPRWSGRLGKRRLFRLSAKVLQESLTEVDITLETWDHNVKVCSEAFPHEIFGR